MEENTVVIFPGVLTHLYNIKPKSTDVIVFSSIIQNSNYCQEVHGNYKCDGFTKES